MRQAETNLKAANIRENGPKKDTSRDRRMSAAAPLPLAPSKAVGVVANIASRFNRRGNRRADNMASKGKGNKVASKLDNKAGRAKAKGRKLRAQLQLRGN